MKKSILLLSAAGLCFAAWRGTAAPLPDSGIPMPADRPGTAQPVVMPGPSSEITGAIPRLSMQAPVTELKAGLDALSNKNPVRAIAVRDSMSSVSLDRHILTWAIATSGQRGVPSSEIASAARELREWPGLTMLRGHLERAVFRENPPAGIVISTLGMTAPETPEGVIVLSRALVGSGKLSDAAKTLRRLWVSDLLDKDQEDKVLKEFAGLLHPADHKARMDFLMYRGRAAQAKRFSELGQAQSLYKGWAAVAQNAPNADAQLRAVSSSWASDPGYLFARIETLRREDRYSDAARLLDKAPADATRLVNTAEWWNERRIVARGLADAGQFKQAYRVSAEHAGGEATDLVDAEFHAGWYALRGLNDPVTAQKHFLKILASSTRPLSASRAWYWMGRAAEAGGSGKATDYFAKAAAHSTTFYGQLAAARLNSKALNVSYPSPSNEDRRRFESREAVRAVARLDAAGHGWRGDSLYRALGQQLQSPGELAILASRAEKNGNHQLSLQIGKSAYSRGIDVAALAFPIGVIPASANIAGSGKALAYAIARQESAFNPGAVSPADARGLLQILPGTAKGVASRHGLSYVAARLTNDAGYNATLGAHYLGEQIDAFGGSYILTFIAYNAGPKRVPEWVARYGDPRGKSIDEVVDWIERIPFPETRNYVQRVMENYQVYKTRLGQSADIEHDLRFGR